MSDLMLKTAVAAKVRISNWRNTTAEAVRRRAGDRGQTAVEYLGIIAVVVAIILVLLGTDFGNQIANAITSKIGKIAG